MEPAPNIRLLRQLARKQGRILIRERGVEDSWALITPDIAGKGTDPDGKKSAAAAFDQGLGMTLQDVDDILNGRDI